MSAKDADSTRPLHSPDGVRVRWNAHSHNYQNCRQQYDSECSECDHLEKMFRLVGIAFGVFSVAVGIERDKAFERHVLYLSTEGTLA